MVGRFTYARPKTLSEALDALAAEGAIPLAGGTDLLVQIRSGALNPQVIIDIKGLDELYGIEEQGDQVRIGPLTTINDLLGNSLLEPYTALLDGAKVLGCHEIRNRATIGGNICNASSSGDVLIPLLLFDPVLVIQGPQGENRKVFMEDFFTGPGKTILNKGEILTGIFLPRKTAGKSLYRRKSRVKGMDLSTISMGLSVCPLSDGTNFYGIIFGALSSRPFRMKEAEAILSGNPLSEKLLGNAVAAVQRAISPRESSLRGTPHYKRAMVRVMLEDGILELAGRQCDEA